MMNAWYLQWCDDSSDHLNKFDTKAELIAFMEKMDDDQEAIRVIYGEELNVTQRIVVEIGDPAGPQRIIADYEAASGIAKVKSP